MEINLIVEAVKFMVIGLTTVFLFLWLLIIVLKIESRVVQRLFPPRMAVKATPKTEKKKEVNEEITAAIVAAVTQHRNRKR